jgi:hypothetical protein
VEGCCEHGNEPGSIKCWKFLEWLHNLWLIEMVSALWVSEWVSKTQNVEMLRSSIKAAPGLENRD